MSDEHRYVLGKIDYNGRGRRNCEVALVWELREGRFSMQGEIWNPRKSDLYSCGQNVSGVCGYFSQDKKAQRMLAIWERWHLNDMQAGSPRQMAYLREHPIDPKSYTYPKSYYEIVSQVLTDAGLNPDNGYLYGHSWLLEEIPADVVAEIQSWSA